MRSNKLASLQELPGHPCYFTRASNAGGPEEGAVPSEVTFQGRCMTPGPQQRAHQQVPHTSQSSRSFTRRLCSAGRPPPRSKTNCTLLRDTRHIGSKATVSGNYLLRERSCSETHPLSYRMRFFSHSSPSLTAPRGLRKAHPSKEPCLHHQEMTALSSRLSLPSWPAGGGEEDKAPPDAEFQHQASCSLPQLTHKPAREPLAREGQSIPSTGLWEPYILALSQP